MKLNAPGLVALLYSALESTRDLAIDYVTVIPKTGTLTFACETDEDVHATVRALLDAGAHLVEEVREFHGVDTKRPRRWIGGWVKYMSTEIRIYGPHTDVPASTVEAA